MALATDTLKAGLLGYGYAGATFHAPLIRAVPGLDPTHFASRQPDAIRAHFPDAAIHDDPAAVLGDPSVDLVVVATPNATHFRWRRQRFGPARAWSSTSPSRWTLPKPGR